MSIGHVYSRLKIFKFPEKIASLPRANPTVLPPLQIRIKPTNICNHSCSYCAYHTDDLQLGKDMVMRDAIPRDKMLEIVDDVASMGVGAVTFSGGGEPFVYPYLQEAIERLVKDDVGFASLTNGSRLNGAIAELFAFKGTWLRISIDGWDAESYAKYRNVSEKEFGKVMANMEAFLKLGGPCKLSVIINVDRTNAAHVYEHIQRLVNLGVQTIKIAPVIYNNDGTENYKYHLPVLDEVTRQFEKAQKEFPEVELYSTYTSQTQTFEKEYHWCPFIQIRPVIGADLNVYACHDKAYNLDTGLLFSIKDRSFKEAWMANKEQFFKVDPSVVCNHHCMVHENNQMLMEFLDIDSGHLRFA